MNPGHDDTWELHLYALPTMSIDPESSQRSPGMIIKQTPITDLHWQPLLSKMEPPQISTFVL